MWSPQGFSLRCSLIVCLLLNTNVPESLRLVCFQHLQIDPAVSKVFTGLFFFFFSSLLSKQIIIMTLQTKVGFPVSHCLSLPNAVFFLAS